MAQRALIVGASGLIGDACMRAFVEGGHDVITMSRRPITNAASSVVRQILIDVYERSAVADAIANLGRVDFIVYAAVYEQSNLVQGWTSVDQMRVNLDMLSNVLDPLERMGATPHVTLLQGTKAYGVHLHPIPLPARESAPRDPHESFYWLQEDYLRERADRLGWGWTILRPVHVVGPAVGVAYSTPPVIGAFAELCRQLNMPFGFPAGDHRTVKQVVDARLVGRAAEWTATTEASWGEHYNLTNGEVFSWRDIWPSLSRMLNIDCNEIEPLSMSVFLPAQGATWAAIARRYDLVMPNINEVIGKSHMYADYTFAYEAEAARVPAVVSDVKIRRAGFPDVYETEESFQYAFDTLVERGVLPRQR